MDYNRTKQAIEELFRDNIRLYPEMYPVTNENEALATAERVALGYWENRTDEEIESDSENELTKDDYVAWCKQELKSWFEENKVVEFQDDNRTMVVARGFASENDATSAIDAFLGEQGEEYGREANGSEEDGVWYYKVTVAN